MYAVTVTFLIAHKHVARFMPLILENARASVRDEPGCHRFDVCTDPARPGEVFLYELYEDAAAFDDHRRMPHYAAFTDATVQMVEEKHVATFANVEA